MCDHASGFTRRMRFVPSRKPMDGVGFLESAHPWIEEARVAVEVGCGYAQRLGTPRSLDIAAT
jgi:hypothetical protein